MTRKQAPRPQPTTAALYEATYADGDLHTMQAYRAKDQAAAEQEAQTYARMFDLRVVSVVQAGR